MKSIVNKESIDNKIEDKPLPFHERLNITIFGLIPLPLYPFFKTSCFILEKITKDKGYKEISEDFNIMTFGYLKAAYTGNVKYTSKHLK